MELCLSIYELHTPIVLPLGYHHILQSIFYHLMADESGNAELHDRGAKYQRREYKLFTFGPIEGKYRIANGKIIFFETIKITFRALDSEIVQRMAKRVKEEGITFGDVNYRNVDVQMSDYHVEQNELIVRQRSPICVYSTNVQTGQTHYYNPWMKEFCEGVKANFNRKYYAKYSVNEEIDFSCIDVRKEDKYITKYKGFIIEAYRGTYRIKGEPELLDFLYQTGLGAKNSQGFGMFDIV